MLKLLTTFYHSWFKYHRYICIIPNGGEWMQMIEYLYVRYNDN